jgi:hypothetical protein
MAGLVPAILFGGYKEDRRSLQEANLIERQCTG